MDSFKASGLIIPELSFPKVEQKPKLIRADNPPPIPLSQKFLVGAVAGILGTSVIYPVDLMKTQIQSSTNSSIAATVTRVFRSGGLYRGFSACLIGIAPEKAIKLAVNDGMRDYFIQTRNNGGKIMLHQEILSGSLAGFLQLLVTVPYESIKIQMQMATVTANAKRESAMSILRSMGPVGMYRGFTATLFRDVPFCLLFFPLYSNVKEFQLKSLSTGFSGKHLMENDLPVIENGKEPFHVGLVAGIVAGAISAAAVTPADMLKTRIQQKMNGNLGFFQYARSVMENEGMSALFKGWQARVMVIAPLYGIVSLAFELQKQWLSSN